MRKLAIDLGKRKTGFAISDETNKIALQLETYQQEKSNFANIIQKIEKYLEQYEIDKIILGYPLKKNGEKSESTIFVENFKKHLQMKINIPVIFVNEYNSSVIANAFLISVNVSRKKRKKSVDKIAAQIILNDYLNNYFINESEEKNG